MRRISQIAASLFLLMFTVINAMAIERRAIAEVSIDALIGETQKFAKGQGMHLVWWMPPEFWRATVARENLPKAEFDAFAKVMDRYSLFAVAQADNPAGGSFLFYDRGRIAQGLKIELVNNAGRKELKPLDDVPEDLRPLLDAMAPMMANLLGNFGKSFNIFVVLDEAEGGRAISPYQSGALSVLLGGEKGVALEPLTFELPLDSLHVARLCPNGKPAHISWVVCPWDGTKLPQ